MSNPSSYHVLVVSLLYVYVDCLVMTYSSRTSPRADDDTPFILFRYSSSPQDDNSIVHTAHSLIDTSTQRQPKVNSLQDTKIQRQSSAKSQLLAQLSAKIAVHNKRFVRSLKLLDGGGITNSSFWMKQHAPNQGQDLYHRRKNSVIQRSDRSAPFWSLSSAGTQSGPHLEREGEPKWLSEFLFANQLANLTGNSTMSQWPLGNTSFTQPATPLAPQEPTVPSVFPVEVPRLRRVVCNFNSSSATRNGTAKFLVQDMNSRYCTDLYYSHATVQVDTYRLDSISKLDILPVDENLFLPGFTVINDFKVANPSLRTFLTVTDSEEISFAEIVLERDKRVAFVTSCVRNLRLWGFDGLNLMWLYPPQPGQLTKLLSDLRDAFDEEKEKNPLRMSLQLAVTLSRTVSPLQHFYDVNAINSLVNQLTIMAFWENRELDLAVTRVESPLYCSNNCGYDQRIGGDDDDVPVVKNKNASDNTSFIPEHLESITETESDSESLVREEDEARVSQRVPADLEARRVRRVSRDISIDGAVREWVRLGVDKSKLNVAISLIGRGYTLTDGNQTGIGAPVSGTSPPGVAHIPGQVYLYEMCENVKTGTVVRISSMDKTPYWYNDSTWVSYEDLESIAQKIEYLKNNHVHGVLLSSQSEDDFTGDFCHLGHFPVFAMAYNQSAVGYQLVPPVSSHAWKRYCGTATRLISTTRHSLAFFLSSLLLSLV